MDGTLAWGLVHNLCCFYFNGMQSLPCKCHSSSSCMCPGELPAKDGVRLPFMSHKPCVVGASGNRRHQSGTYILWARAAVASLLAFQSPLLRFPGWESTHRLLQNVLCGRPPRLWVQRPPRSPKVLVRVLDWQRLPPYCCNTAGTSHPLDISLNWYTSWDVMYGFKLSTFLTTKRLVEFLSVDLRKIQTSR